MAFWRKNEQIFFQEKFEEKNFHRKLKKMYQKNFPQKILPFRDLESLGLNNEKLRSEHCRNKINGGNVSQKSHFLKLLASKF